jgi:ABC-2 type transport system ATP-binding protein
VEFSLEALGVSKRYGDCDALRRVDLVVRPGHLHGLVGPNGAGKTTLLRILLGLVRRDAGTVRLLGHNLDSTTRPVPHGVAGLVDTPAFYPYLSGRQNLALLGCLDEEDGTRVSAGTIDRALEQVGLAARADDRAAGYSAGMRQRLGLAAVLLRSPQLLLLDEPTSSLDPAGARDVRALARSLADGGAAVVLSSHDLNEVEDLCTALTIVDRGRVVFSGTMDALKKLAPGMGYLLHTSDDGAALALASKWPDIRVVPAADGSGLDVSAAITTLDAYIIGLGCAGVAVRRLEHRGRTLEWLFLQLTGENIDPAALDAVDDTKSSSVAS